MKHASNHTFWLGFSSPSFFPYSSAPSVIQPSWICYWSPICIKLSSFHSVCCPFNSPFFAQLEDFALSETGKPRELQHITAACCLINIKPSARNCRDLQVSWNHFPLLPPDISQSLATRRGTSGYLMIHYELYAHVSRLVRLRVQSSTADSILAIQRLMQEAVLATTLVHRKRFHFARNSNLMSISL